jgi:transketolase
VLWDDNKITIDGAVELSSSEDIKARYVATGWHVASCDGHDPADIARAIDAALADPRPSLIACRTIIGKGAPNKQGTSATHGSALGAEEVAAARTALGWTAEPFVIPDDILDAWRASGRRSAAARSAWEARLVASPNGEEFTRRMNGLLPKDTGMRGYIDGLTSNPPKIATRKSSEMALDVLTATIPEMLGGSADLTGSNLTRTKATSPFNRDNYGGRYVSYGIREFGMAAAMNGMALHGGIIPYGGTFLVFADYCRNAIRLSAIQKARVVYVMTHDSIGVGEDGPTHQPIEHLMSLRAMPGLNVFRPADAVETAECWELALQNANGPSLLALSRQNLTPVRLVASENMSAKGAYRVQSANAERQVVLVATGSEVELAMSIAAALEARGIGADVVSMPCSELFDLQDKNYREDVLPKRKILIVSIEAGVTLGWQKYVGDDGLSFGIDRYGASAPIAALYDYFGLTVDKILPQIVSKLAR